MVNIPPKVTCKYTRLLPVAVYQQFYNFNQDLNSMLCRRIHIFYMSFILFMSIVT